MPLTKTQQDALNAFLATLDLTPATPTPWWHQTGSAPTSPLTDITNEAELKRYMSFGFRADLTRGVAPSDFERYRRYADDVGRAEGGPENADAAIAGAGRYPTDTAIFLLLGGAGQGGDSGWARPYLYAPWTIQTIPEANAYLTGVVLPSDPGASGRP
jgi:hypothetical protein